LREEHRPNFETSTNERLINDGDFWQFGWIASFVLAVTSRAYDQSYSQTRPQDILGICRD